MGGPFRRGLKRIFAEQAKAILGVVPAIGAPIPASFPPLTDYDDPMAAAMTPLLSAYWDWAGKATRVRLGLDPDAWRVVDPNLHKAVAAQALTFCSKTNATTTLRLSDALAALRSELQAGLVDAGEAIPQLKKRVLKIFTGLRDEHAGMIARTEASRAVHAASLMSAEQSGVAGGKRWLASGNSCDRCLELEKKTREAAVGLGDAFATVASADPAYATIPSPPLHPHCRCTIVYDLTPEYRAMVEEEGGKAPPAVAPLDASAPKVKRAPKPPAFPRDPEKLELVKTLGGSTGAELVKDAWGRQWVRKRGANADHLREEALADEAYRRLGVAVPKSKLFETKAGPVKLAEWIEGRTLGQLAGDAYEAAAAGLRKGFVADALLGNWDVVGMGLDNVLVDPAGKVWRIDNGGSLRYRAQGQAKGGAWDDHPTELWTLRDSAKNRQSAGVFGKLTFAEIADQVDGLKGVTGAKLKLPAEVAGVVDARLAQMRDVASIGRAMIADKFKDNYADGYAKHTMGLRAAGISGRMPTRLSRPGGRGVEVVDQDGKPWDHLRGKGSIVGDLHKYVDANGGNAKTLQAWASGQAGSSWSPISVAMKALLAGERDVPKSSYFWRDIPDPEKSLAAVAEKAGGMVRLRESVLMQHAFSGELIRRAEFDNRSGDGRRVTVYRTENADVLRKAGISPGDKDVLLKRGVAESTSIFLPVTVFGSEVTVQTVATHRILGTYFQARADGGAGGNYLGDRENEFLAILDDVKLEYRGGGGGGKKKKGGK